MADRDPLSEIIKILVSLVRSIQLKRVLVEVDADPTLNFWRVLHGNLLDIAALEWCKLFGSDDEEHQKTHWKNLVKDHNSFRNQLLTKLGIDEKAWVTYWQEMKTYRDQHVAHRDLKKPDVAKFPKLDIALNSSYFYYQYVLEELKKRDGTVDYPEDLSCYSEAFFKQSKDIALNAIKATAQFEEKVY